MKVWLVTDFTEGEPIGIFSSKLKALVGARTYWSYHTDDEDELEYFINDETGVEEIEVDKV